MLRKADFAPLVNASFTLLFGGDPLEMELIGIDDRSSERVENFSLLFRGPLQRPFPQATYAVSQAALGEFQLFLVPVARNSDGMQYEAVFNLVLDS